MKLPDGIAGSIYRKRNRFYYQFKEEGKTKATIVALVPPGQSRATDCQDVAIELARIKWRQVTGAADIHDGSIAGLMELYDKHLDEYYRDENGKPTAYRSTVNNCLKMFRVVEGSKLAAQYTSINLYDFRTKMISAPKSEKDTAPRYCRKEINRRMNVITRFFKWAENRHHVPAGTSAPMIVMEKIKPGFMGAADYKKVVPIDDNTVDITCEFAPPVVRDMIRVMQLSGMRPKELCGLKPCDIDRSDQQVWSYDMDKHKTSYLGKDRVIYFGPACQKILRPYLLRGEKEFIFSPREAQTQRAEKRRNNRVTPSHWGTPSKGLNANIGLCYTTQTFRRAVYSAVRHAQIAGKKIERWFPYQLRHAFGTKMDRLFGIETSAAAMGNNVDTAKIYIQKRLEYARIAASKVG